MKEAEVNYLEALSAKYEGYTKVDICVDIIISFYKEADITYITDHIWEEDQPEIVYESDDGFRIYTDGYGLSVCIKGLNNEEKNQVQILLKDYEVGFHW